MIESRAQESDLACREFVEIVTAYLEGALDEQATLAAQSHLSHCPGCDLYLAQMLATIAAVGHVPVESLSPQAKADLTAAFRDFHTRSR